MPPASRATSSVGAARSAGYVEETIGQREDTLLQVRDLVVRFGGLLALDRVSFDVAAGEIRGLIGPNGSGKTTLFNCISNIYRPDSGEIRLGGERISGLPRHR